MGGHWADDDPVDVPYSAVEENVWPAVPDDRAGRLLALLGQFEDTQWWSPQRLWEHQSQQLQRLLRHAQRTVPYYRQCLPAGLLQSGQTMDPAVWRQLPLLTRSALQSAGESLLSRAVPASHGGLHATRTSGATGQPVTVTTTGLAGLLWSVLALRDHRWQRRKLSGKLCSIRAVVPAAAMRLPGIELPSWGAPTDAVYPTGRSALLGLSVEVGQQVQWLRSQRPQYLLTYPNNLRALAARFIAEGTGLPGLLQVRTIGETVTQAIREDCRKAFGVELADAYSSEEVGGIALQCPAGEGYHIQSESVLVEVLDDAGTPCAPGEVGRIVVTPLHNFAMPLLRYELRDYAEVGEPCHCGRGLPVLRRILGRSRNMLVLPNGERRWPLTGFAQFREIAPISQFQFEQESLSLIEARIVAERALSPFERTRLIETIQTALRHPFEIRIVEVAEIPRSANGKFEDFISRLDASTPDRPRHEQN